MRKIFSALALGLMLALLFASTSVAQVLSVRLRAIQASNVGATVDSSLRDIHNQLGSLFNFTSYRLLREEDLSLYPQLAAAFQVHPKTYIEITMVRQYKEGAELKIRVIREGIDILNTTVRLFRGKDILIGGPRHGKGVIIYALSTRS